jgi:glyoxylase-like metal-dependent hydrolase (beta-lactamase superfamily II)
MLCTDATEGGSVRSRTSQFEVAGLRCVLLGTGRFDMDASVLFGSAPSAELATARARFGAEKDPLVFQIHPLFVETPSHRVVVDPGTSGDGLSLADELFAVGVAPESIDTVVLTHGHSDHWNSSLVVEGDGGAAADWSVAADREVRPAFPNASYFLQHDEWDHWFGEPNPEPIHAAPFRNVLGRIRDRLELLKGSREVVPGVEVWPTPGHSPGHQVVIIGGAAVHVGDVLLHPICVEHPGWTARFDVRPAEVVESRLALLERACAEDLLVITHHFAWPGVGRVSAKGGRYIWKSGG